MNKITDENIVDLRPNFDDIIKEQLEKIFPIKVLVENSRGIFLFDERFPPFKDLKIALNNASYDDVSNHLTFGYDIIENPNNINHNSIDLREILFKIVSYIYEVESKLILQTEYNKKHGN